MRRPLLLAVFLIAALAGLLAGALTPQPAGQPSLEVTQTTPAESSTSRSYVVGYEVIVSYGGQNVTVASSNASLAAGPRIGAVSLGYGLGYGLAAESYVAGQAGSPAPAQVIIPPVGYTTVTETQTVTITETVTKTVTITDSEGRVYTTVVTIPAPASRGGSGGDGAGSGWKLPPGALGAGIVALLFLAFLATRRG